MKNDTPRLTSRCQKCKGRRSPREFSPDFDAIREKLMTGNREDEMSESRVCEIEKRINSSFDLPHGGIRPRNSLMRYPSPRTSNNASACGVDKMQREKEREELEFTVDAN